MTTYSLKPCTIRHNRIVPQEDAADLSLSLKQMLDRFAKTDAARARHLIATLRQSAFFGLLRDEAGRPRAFTIFNPSRDERIDWLLRKNPSFPAAVIEVYRVEQVARDTKFTNERSDERNEAA